MDICKWIRNDNTKCVLQTIEGKNYCKLHKKYEGLYKPEILHTLLRCKRCDKICETLNDKNKCDKCINRQNKMVQKRKENKVKCKWINQNSQPCPFNAIINKQFCNHHIKYENKKLNNMNKCSTCRNMFEVIQDEKICLKCKELSKKNRDKNKEHKKYCIAIIQKTGKQCVYKQCDENEYCKKHQIYKKIKELEEQGLRICSNKNRGCLHILEYDDKSKCKLCKNLANNTKNVSSKTLYDKQYIIYKSEAKRRNKCWCLTEEETITLFKQKCHYCDYLDGINGIDRIDSSKNYEISNVVPCCTYCNIMKNTKSYENFRIIINHLFNTLIENNKVNYENEKLFEISKHKTYNSYKLSSETRHISFQLDIETFDKIIKMPCYYCKLFNNGSNGIDRLNSNGPYTNDNVVPCCKTCNSMKNDLTFDNFTLKIQNIYNKFIKNEKINYNDPKTKLLTLLSINNYKICNFKPIRMVKNHEFYLNKIFNGNIYNVKNIKIKLEFIDSSNKLEFSIWQYYRRYISSFRKKENSTLVGKQIYILVKDEITDNCLGIISLSSDLKYLKERDNFIGWNSKEYLTNNKLSYLMNISTCVSTQPFGFNFNGGKLLTSLVFSKEVLFYIKEKYNIYIQGFTTMSLYGKSIQYERLPYIKLVGYTNGSSLTNISTDVINYCKYYLHENKINIPNDNLWIVTKTLKKLNISVEDFLKTNKKGIYFGFTHKHSKDFLQGKISNEPNCIDNAKSMQEIYNWWLNRWAKQRYSYLESTNKCKSYEECIQDIKNQI
jgi:hypothetical protein